MHPSTDPRDRFGIATRVAGWVGRCCRCRPCLRRIQILVAMSVALGIPYAGTTVRASPGDGAFEPNGRGSQLLGSREAVLATQSERARRAARARGLALYRMLRFAVTELRAGNLAPGDGRDPLGGRAVVLATAVLERDLTEARLLRAELDRVRAERALLGPRTGPGGRQETGPESPGDAVATAPPSPPLLRPVDGAMVTPFGVGRDIQTGTWIFRAAVSFATPSPQPVRCPADARVVRVAASLAGGAAVVLAHDQNRWTTVISGFSVVSVATGDFVRRGGTLGTSSRGAGATVRIETWRGRTPIDPASLLRPR